MRLRIKALLLFFLFVSGINSFAQQFNEHIVSPDKNITCNVYRNAGAGIFYTVSYKGKPVVVASELNIQLDNHWSEWTLAIKNKPGKDWMQDLQLKNAVRTTKDTTWAPLYGERKLIKDHYNNLTLQFEQKASSNYRMNIEIRVYNEGIALRYYFPDNPTGIYYRITADNTEFSFPEGTQAWFEPWAQGAFTKLPLKNWPSESEGPLTLELPNGLYAAVAEAQRVDFVKTRFTLASKPNTIKTLLYESVDKVPYFGTPWRVVMIGEQPGKLIENNFIFQNLNDPAKLTDVSYIKPGKIVRDLTLTEKGAKEWIDFAAAHNLQYVLFDWKWYGPAFTFDSDAGKVAIDLDLPEVIRYGKEKGVGIWLYVNQQALLKQDFEIFPIYKKWGIAGVKYGFVEVGSHRWTTWLHESVQRAANNGLMVNIHDEFRLTGEERTWPNMLTVEGIRGNEEMPDATHNVTLPFTRGLAGAGDYTICYYTNRIKTTHTHQLALGVVMYSPLQTLYWYDKASDYKNEPEIEFFDKLPTVWDDTKVLQGRAGEYIVTARKKGNDWFVGVMTNNSAREVEITFDFLDKGKTYSLSAYEDDDTVATKTKVKVTRDKVKQGKKRTVKLKASGGAAFWISPTK
ncbi:alpha-glucosidase [Flavobacterium sp. Sd200]|uniref:glycoside hydrolase family 97 protein n=1 Tax=Flavobacterium sp. Sd200 TaxID=2692211 RepID=UPI00137174CC|nr:glycoside hydrolase family 97 protein [Flavobacterium sp. Sd200]MXN90766.1 alpha-glucosidase [Flavobacterium sp. Sd200]